MSCYGAGIAEFESLVEWCGCLIDQKNAPGFVVGISGTDSILAFLICAEAFRRRGRSDRVIGVHFGRDFPDPDITPERLAKILGITPSYRWVAREVFPWLRRVAPGAQLMVDTQGVDLDDHARWAKLFAISLAGASKTEMLDGTQNYWVVGTRNATEEVLGTYSNLSMAASLQPIIRLWKSDVLRICRLLGVPEVAVSQSRQVDCDCGRFDLAANHIEEVDVLLRRRTGRALASDADVQLAAELEGRLNAFIDEQVAASDFKRQIPYMPAPALPSQRSGNQIGLSRAVAEISGMEVSAGFFDAAVFQWMDMLPTFETVRRAAMKYGYGFSSWRFVAMRVEGKSLLEHYGFRRLARDTDRYPDPELKEPDRDLFGPGFVLSDGVTYLELRRAYILVSWKVKGVQVALAIRNNSTYFGRDRLPAPVLVSIGQFECSDLEALTPTDFVRHFEPIENFVTPESWTFPISMKELGECLSDQVNYIRSFEIGFDDWILANGRCQLLEFLEQLGNNGHKLPHVGLTNVGDPQWFPSNVMSLEDGNVELILSEIRGIRQRGMQRIALLSGLNGDRP